MADIGAGAAVYIAREWIPKLIKMLGRISGERKAQLDQIALDFPDPQELARYYVEPNCQLVNPANLPDGEHHMHRKPAFETIDYFLQQPSLDRDGTNHLMVLGDAGMGKSSLLVMLWKMHLFGFWPKDVECTLLKLGSTTLAKIAEISAPSRHVLLLDALDEDSSFSESKGGAKGRLVELIQASKGFRKIIISCRTQFFVDEDDDPTFAKLGNVRLEGFTCPITYLSPFDDRQAAELLEKRFPDGWRNYLLFRPNTARQRAMGIAEAMGSLNMRPLLLSYIPFLLGNDPNDQDPLDIEGEDREYEIYRMMVTRWLDREVIKIRELGAAAVPRAEDLREICWQVATSMKLDGRRKMSRSAFETLKTQLGAPGFLTDNTLEGRALLNKDSSGNFRFAHYSIQEFLIVEQCLTRGVFLRGEDLKSDLDASDLMRRFFEQRLRAGFRSIRSIDANSRPRHMDFHDQLALRACFAPVNLSSMATTMIGFCKAEASRRGHAMAFALDARDWSITVQRTTVAVLLHELRVTLAELADAMKEMDGLDHSDKLNKLDAIDAMDTADKAGIKARLSTMAMFAIDATRIKTAIMDKVDAMDELDTRYIMDKIGKIYGTRSTDAIMTVLYSLAISYISAQIEGLDKLDAADDIKMSAMKMGDKADMDGILNIINKIEINDINDKIAKPSITWQAADLGIVATLAAQFAAGESNLGIPEHRLATICREELQKAWPIR